MLIWPTPLPPHLPSAHLTWCTLGKPCLLDDSEFGLWGTRLGLQRGWWTFPRQALRGLGATGVSRQYSSMIGGGWGTSVWPKRRQWIFTGKALIKLPCFNRRILQKQRCHLSSANQLQFLKSYFRCDACDLRWTLSEAGMAVTEPLYAGRRCSTPSTGRTAWGGTGCFPKQLPSTARQQEPAACERAGAQDLTLQSFLFFVWKQKSTNGAKNMDFKIRQLTLYKPIVSLSS